MNILRASVIGLAGVVGAGVLAWPAMSAASGDTEEVYKRDDQTPELVTVDDQDDDDTNGTRVTDTRDNDTRDNTRGDNTRGDNTRGDNTRGDNTRNDTRGDR
jgi:hypothetical protein